MRKTSKAALGASAAAIMAAGVAQAETWDMPVAYPSDNYHTETAEAFAAEVRDCTGGELEIVVHANGSLFKGDEIKRAVQTGDAQLGERLLSAHANENAIFAYDSVPFLASSFDASEKLRQAAEPVLAEVLSEQGLTLLYSVPWPAQGMYFGKEINSVSEMAGIKFRAYNASTARVAELAGMVPTQVEAAELKQALATGVVSAMITSGSTGVDEKAWEDLSHFYDVKAWLPRNTVFANTAALDALSAEQRDCVMTAARNAQEQGAAQAEALAGGFLDQLAENGMTVIEPGEQLAADLAAIGEQMTDEWLQETGDKGQQIVEAFRAE